MSGSFDHIRIDTARDTVDRLRRTADHLAHVATMIDQAISLGDLGPELAGARMIVGELLEEIPALSRTIGFKVEQMLAVGSNSTVSSMFATWQYEAQTRLEESIDDGSRAGPDAGGTFSATYRGGFTIDGSDPTQAGIELVQNMLLTTGDGALVAQDEFQLIQLDDGKFVLVLPGVTDLSSPDFGFDDHHRSVRDLDRYAMESAASTELARNGYAVMVRDALARAQVPVGADIAIVGHSFGADTALDLAADPMFNGGPRGYNISHVVAAGYHSGPQLGHVPESTEVLVLQNHHDAAILAETWGHMPGQVLHGHLPAPNKATALPVAMVGATAIPAAQAAVDAGGFIIGSVFNLGGDVINHAVRRTGITDHEIIGDVHINDFDDIFSMNDGVSQPRPNQVVDVFEGAFEGVGHHPNNYATRVATTDDPAMLDFFASIGAGYSGRGERWSIDVTVPDEP